MSEQIHSYMIEPNSRYATTFVLFLPLVLFFQKAVSTKRAINIHVVMPGLLPCGQRCYIGIMILLLSHSPSVKSVAGKTAVRADAGKV